METFEEFPRHTNTSKSGNEKQTKTREVLFYDFLPVFAVAASLVVGGVLFLFSSINPLLAYASIAAGAFGTPRRIASTLLRFTPLLFSSLGIAVAFKTKTGDKFA